MITNIRPLAREKEIVVQELDCETLVYDLKNNRAVCLNETAARVWRLCDGTRTMSEIGVEVGKQMRTTLDENLVWFAIGELDGDGLIAKGFRSDNRFTGLTRREVVRRIGIASLVALPIVSSIAAPQAAAAQSVCTFDPMACVPANTNVCPASCTGMSITYNLYSSTDGSCTGFIAPNSSACGPGGFDFNNDSEVIGSF